ncbi:LuxR C-terminal-related transcriptional regulator [Streptomyces sp. NPDC092369]|uniref:helix-turn-helix transcriptional regulator n=1 Tax=Streptomyces sp. NPDC092369 TaxID=3366015 RepID=UPI0038019482
MSSIPMGVFGREQALNAIDALFDRLRGEASTEARGPEGGAIERTLLFVGEPGIGKTSLLEAGARKAKDLGGQARWVVGRTEEAGLAFSGLDALLHPWRKTLAGIDAEDRSILRTVLRGGETVTGGTLALAGALLRVLSTWADAGPVLVIIDDLQWLDRSSHDLLSLCAHRLEGEPVGFLLASRPTGLPAAWTRQSTLHRLEDLDEIQAARLLDSLATPPEGRTRRQVLRQAGGNPLALVELTRAAATRSLGEERAGLELPLTERLEQLFAADLEALPRPTRRLLTLAAVADLPDMAALTEILGDVLLPEPDEVGLEGAVPVGQGAEGNSVDGGGGSQDGRANARVRHGDSLDGGGGSQGAPANSQDTDGDSQHLHATTPTSPDLTPHPPEGTPTRRAQVARAADEAWAAAEKAGLLTLREGVVRFRHPLVRSAVLAAAPFDERSQAHRLIASVPDLDEDRRAWHRAAAMVTADEGVAAALEATAERARRRGGYAAAAVTLERAAQLSPRTEDRVRRLNAAAEFAAWAGHPRWVAELTSTVAAIADTEEARVLADTMGGWAFVLTSRHGEAMDRLTAAADASWPDRPDRVMDALGTAATVGYQSGDPRFRAAILSRYRRLPPREPTFDSAWILAGCDALDAREEALAHLRHAAAEEDQSLMAWAALGAAAWALDETEMAVNLLGTMLEIYRQAATAGANATVASAHALALFEVGRWPAALASLSESDRAASAAGGMEIATLSNHILASTLAAVRGDSERAKQTLADAVRDYDLRGTRTFDVRARQASALAALAEGDHEVAYFHLSRYFHRDGSPVHFHSSYHGLGDLAASAVRTGRSTEAQATLDTAMGQLPANISLRLHLILCRAQGLLTDDATRAEELLREAASTPDGDQWPFERALALADLGEWLRRRQRPADARAPLGEALELFQGLGAAPWTTRTAAELRATGVDTAEGRRPDATMELTPQQLAIVQLAAQGLSNKEIAARLFLSPRTVGFHLNRAFPKLGVTSRFQLRDVVA